MARITDDDMLRALAELDNANEQVTRDLGREKTLDELNPTLEMVFGTMLLKLGIPVAHVANVMADLPNAKDLATISTCIALLGQKALKSSTMTHSVITGLNGFTPVDLLSYVRRSNAIYNIVTPFNWVNKLLSDPVAKLEKDSASSLVDKKYWVNVAGSKHMLSFHDQKSIYEAMVPVFQRLSGFTSNVYIVQPWEQVRIQDTLLIMMYYSVRVESGTGRILFTPRVVDTKPHKDERIEKLRKAARTRVRLLVEQLKDVLAKDWKEAEGLETNLYAVIVGMKFTFPGIIEKFHEIVHQIINPCVPTLKENAINLIKQSRLNGDELVQTFKQELKVTREWREKYRDLDRISHDMMSKYNLPHVTEAKWGKLARLNYILDIKTTLQFAPSFVFFYGAGVGELARAAVKLQEAGELAEAELLLCATSGSPRVDRGGILTLVGEKNWQEAVSSDKIGIIYFTDLPMTEESKNQPDQETRFRINLRHVLRDMKKKPQVVVIVEHIIPYLDSTLQIAQFARDLGYAVSAIKHPRLHNDAYVLYFMNVGTFQGMKPEANQARLLHQTTKFVEEARIATSCRNLYLELGIYNVAGRDLTTRAVMSYFAAWQIVAEDKGEAAVSKKMRVNLDEEAKTSLVSFAEGFTDNIGTINSIMPEIVSKDRSSIGTLTSNNNNAQSSSNKRRGADDTTVGPPLPPKRQGTVGTTGMSLEDTEADLSSLMEGEGYGDNT